MKQKSLKIIEKVTVTGVVLGIVALRTFAVVGTDDVDTGGVDAR